MNLWSVFFNVLSQLENTDEREVLSLLAQLFTVYVFNYPLPSIHLHFNAELTYFLI